MAAITYDIPSAAAMERLGAELAPKLKPGSVVFLEGNLGAGKTTLVRGLLRGLGYPGNVKSPSFTLIESYSLPQAQVYHFDLYRLIDPEELEFLGYRDYFSPHSICLIEWPQHAQGRLPQPTLTLKFEIKEESRRVSFIS